MYIFGRVGYLICKLVNKNIINLFYILVHLFKTWYFIISLYSLMATQIVLICIIGSSFNSEYTEKIVIEKSGAIWYIIISTYLFPLFGAMIFFLFYNDWLMTRLPVDVMFHLMSQFQTKGMETYRNQEETAATIKEVANYLGKRFQNDYANLSKYNQCLCCTCLKTYLETMILLCLVISFFIPFVICGILANP